MNPCSRGATPPLGAVVYVIAPRLGSELKTTVTSHKCRAPLCDTSEVPDVPETMTEFGREVEMSWVVVRKRGAAGIRPPPA